MAEPQSSVPALDDPSLYINRELSLLEFNRRVVAQAIDEDVPLLERLRFLCIAASNLDEFFEIRVAGLRQQLKLLGAAQVGPDQLSPEEQLTQISALAHELVDTQYQVLNSELLPRLQAQGIRFLRRDEWNARQVRWLERYFENELMPVLSQQSHDPAHPFPRVLNKSLHFVVSVQGEDAYGRRGGVAIVRTPRPPVPRVVRLPSSVSQSPYEFVFLSSVIHAFVGRLFPGMQCEGAYQFRVTRNSDLLIDEEFSDLRDALHEELSDRDYGDAVRLELADDCPEELERFLLEQFDLTERDLYRCNGPVNLDRLMPVPDAIDRPDLKFAPFKQSVPRRLTGDTNIFDAIRRGEILLHHPFQSFNPVVRFVQQAATDPAVMAIRQTLYRTESNSQIVRALVQAARSGKEVTVVIELRARFDEEENIEMSTVLEEAGAHVAYGVVNRKTHAKMSLVVRREGARLRRYVHLGTGNYHARTARLYTDYGLFSADTRLGEDVQKVFQQLMAFGTEGHLEKVLQAPFTLHQTTVQMIDREASLAREGKPGLIRAKMNQCIEPQVIQALYRASQAGVRVELIVRGICGVRPGIAGVSENIVVRSIVGRFLEHTRVFCFGNDGDPLVFLSSADWMGRNFFARVETCFPIEDERLRNRVIHESFDLYMADNAQAWDLQADGSYRRVVAEGMPRFSSQEQLLAELADNE